MEKDLNKEIEGIRLTDMVDSKKEIQKIKEKYGDANLVDMIHQFLSEENQQRQQERYDEGRIGKFYPSSVGQCRRKIAYQMMGYPGKPIPGRNLLIMDNGTYFHERMEDLFERMGIMIAPELKLKDKELRISGRSDAIVWNFLDYDMSHLPDIDKDIQLHQPTDDGEQLVYDGPAKDVLIVEFKSIKSKGYSDYVPKTKPKKEHEMQLQLYFYLTGVRAGLVYYENKDTQEQKYFYVEYKQEIIDEIISDIKYVIDHIDQGKLPEREYQPTSFQCRYCDFKEICYPVKNMYNLDDII